MPLHSHAVSAAVRLMSSSGSRTWPMHSSAAESRPADDGVASYMRISSVRSHRSRDDTSNTKSSSNSGHVVRLWTCARVPKWTAAQRRPTATDVTIIIAVIKNSVSECEKISLFSNYLMCWWKKRSRENFFTSLWITVIMAKNCSQLLLLRHWHFTR